MYHDWKDTSFYMLQDWAFLPIQIALVTVVVGKIMNDHEKQERLEKTRILTSSFFSDLGNELMAALVPSIADVQGIQKAVLPDQNWTKKDFTIAVEELKKASIPLNCKGKIF